MDKFVLSLFDFTGNMVDKWAENGYKCYIVDIKHQKGIKEIRKNVFAVKWDLSTENGLLEYIGVKNYFIAFAFPPCTHLAVCGAVWFKNKGLRCLAESISFFATAVEIFEYLKCPYFLENPVSTISTYWRNPDYTFNPYEFTAFCKDDNYTKKTCLWIGNGFNLPSKKINYSQEKPDQRIINAFATHNKKEWADFRSKTPKGFAEAVYLANCENSIKAIQQNLF